MSINVTKLQQRVTLNSVKGCIDSIADEVDEYVPMNLEQYEIMKQIYKDLIQLQRWFVQNQKPDQTE